MAFLQDLDGRFADFGGELGAIGSFLARGQDDPGADGQRQEEFQRGDVEGQGGDREQGVFPGKARFAPH